MEWSVFRADENGAVWHSGMHPEAWRRCSRQVRPSGIRHSLTVLWDDYLDCCDPRHGLAGGLLLAWLFLLSLSASFSPATGAAGDLWGDWAPAVLAIAFLGITLAPPVRLSRNGLVALLGVAASAMTLGALLFVLLPAHVMPTIGSHMALVLAMCGLAGGLIGYAEICARIRKRSRVGVTATAAIVGAAVYLLFLPLPDVAVPVLGAALPLGAAGLLLSAILAPLADEETGEDEAEAEVPDGSAATPGVVESFGDVRGVLYYERSFAVTIVGFGMLFSFLAHVLDLEPSAERLLAGPFLVGALLLTEIAITVYMIRVAHREDPNIAFRPTGLLAAIGFLALAIAGPGQALLSMAVVFSGIGAFLVYYWIVMGNIAQRFGWASSSVYAQGLCLLVSGMVLGKGVSLALTSAAAEDTAQSLLVAALALFVLAFIFWLKVEGSVFASEPVDASQMVTVGVAEKPALPTAGDARSASRSAALEGLAVRYGISAREREIVELLLRGRNVPYICDELFIAKSTVETHVKHVYSKLGISSRQQLIDIVEREEGDIRE